MEIITFSQLHFLAYDHAVRPLCTEGTLSGFQDCFLQPIIKDRPNSMITRSYPCDWADASLDSPLSSNFCHSLQTHKQMVLSLYVWSCGPWHCLVNIKSINKQKYKICIGIGLNWDKILIAFYILYFCIFHRWHPARENNSGVGTQCTQGSRMDLHAQNSDAQNLVEWENKCIGHFLTFLTIFHTGYTNYLWLSHINGYRMT